MKTESPAPRSPWKTRILLGTTVVASVAGIAAFRTLFARPGEASLRLIPANAAMVVTLDLTPGPGQVLAFKHIDESLEKHGAKNKLELSLMDMFEPTATGKEGLRPLMTRSGSFFMLPRSEKLDDAMPVGLVAVTSGPDAQRALEKDGVTRYYKGTKYYKLRNGNSIYMVADDVLVVSSEPEALHLVKQVQNGAPNILSNPDFVASRGQLADDANMMVFVSPKVAQMLGTEDMMAGWAAMGMSIRDGGMDMKAVGKMNTSKFPAFAALGKVSPLREDLLRVLPKGAYMTMAISQPAKFEEAMESGLGEQAEFKDGLAEMEKGMREELGMDFRKDMLPAFLGNAVLSAYPAKSGKTGLDLLFVVDDFHGADPANAMDRFSAYLDDQAAKDGGPGHFFTRSEKDGVKYAAMDEQMAEDMNRSLFGDGSDTGPFVADPLGKDKTLTYAQIGKTLIVATSKDLLDRAVTSYRDQMDSLAEDNDYATVLPESRNGNQEIVVMSLGRIASGIRGALDEKKLSEEDRKMWNGALSAFESLDSPVLTTAKIHEDGTSSMSSFVPMDYPRLFDFVGGIFDEAKNKAKEAPRPMPAKPVKVKSKSKTKSKAVPKTKN